MTKKKKTRLKIHLPVPIMKLNAVFMKKVLANPPLTSDQLIMFEEENTCYIEEIKKEFGIELNNVEDYITDIFFIKY